MPGGEGVGPGAGGEPHGRPLRLLRALGPRARRALGLRVHAGPRGGHRAAAPGRARRGTFHVGQPREGRGPAGRGPGAAALRHRRRRGRQRLPGGPQWLRAGRGRRVQPGGERAGDDAASRARAGAGPALPRDPGGVGRTARARLRGRDGGRARRGRGCSSSRGCGATWRGRERGRGRGRGAGVDLAARGRPRGGLGAHGRAALAGRGPWAGVAAAFPALRAAREAARRVRSSRSCCTARASSTIHTRRSASCAPGSGKPDARGGGRAGGAGVRPRGRAPPGAERWWRQVTGAAVEVREGVAWALRFEPGVDAAAAALDLAVLRDQAHGLLCNPHAQEHRVSGAKVPLPLAHAGPRARPPEGVVSAATCGADLARRVRRLRRRGRAGRGRGHRPRAARAPASRAGIHRHRLVRRAGGAFHGHKGLGLVSDVYRDFDFARLPGTLGHRPQPLLDRGQPDAREHAAAARGLPRRAARPGAQRQPGERPRAAAAARGLGLHLPDHARHRDLPAPDRGLGRRRRRGGAGRRPPDRCGARTRWCCSRPAPCCALRDPHGFRPLCLGRLAEGWWWRARPARWTWWGRSTCATSSPGSSCGSSRAGMRSRRVSPRASRRCTSASSSTSTSRAPTAACSARAWTGCGAAIGHRLAAEHPARGRRGHRRAGLEQLDRPGLQRGARASATSWG